jgi:hypothetical protein
MQTQHFISGILPPNSYSNHKKTEDKPKLGDIPAKYLTSILQKCQGSEK